VSGVPVSVVIPTSGRFELLERALKSLLRSTLVPREVIVVADSSLKDPSIHLEILNSKYASSFEKLSCIQSSRASGAAGTRNAGLSLVSNEFVAFLDDDDEFLPHKLSRQVSAMQESGSVFCFSDYLRVSSSSSTYADCSPKSRYKGDLAREIAFDDCRIATPTVMLRMSFIEKLNPLFPEQMVMREDNFAWLKIALNKGFSFVHIADALAQVNLEKHSIQRPNAPTKRQEVSIFAPEERLIYALARSNGLKRSVFFWPWAILVRLTARAIERLSRNRDQF
jgi:glycosyltransferase involved in cell wall biosynthesis